MDRKPALPLTVFYDGSCVVCATEMEHYMRKNREGRLVFVDISDPDFDSGRYGGSREEFMAQMHVLDAQGRFYRGVDAFAVIWGVFPGRHYRLLGWFIEQPGVHLLARLGYRGFARLRRYLPKRRGVCDGGSCRMEHRR